MNILFLDTSYNLSLGILDENFEWRDFRYFNDGKSATKLHQALQKLLQDHNLKLAQLDRAIQIAGPGSYTGMRVSDGFFQTLKLFGIKTNSIYHFDILNLLDIEDGHWISNAFKGEIYRFNKSSNNPFQNLFLEKDFIQEFEKNPHFKLYTHFIDAFSPTFKTWAKDQNILETSEMVKKNSKVLFSQVVKQNLEKSLFYYREIDQEFKKPN